MFYILIYLFVYVFLVFFKCNLDLVLDEFSKPIVIQGSRLIFLELILTVFIGKDLSNAFSMTK